MKVPHQNTILRSRFVRLVSYAADRRAWIIPNSMFRDTRWGMLKAYPQYASGEVEGRDYFSAMGSALNPANPETFTFLDYLFGEMAELFPDKYFHVGGDEISGADWKTNLQVQDFMKANDLKTLGELESYFFERVRKRRRCSRKDRYRLGGSCEAPVIPMMSSVQAWRSRMPLPESRTRVTRWSQRAVLIWTNSSGRGPL